MTTTGFGDLISRELDRWSAAGRVAPFWLRDDDATEPGDALDRLLESTERFGVPVTLAVIPAATGLPLALRLETAPLAEVAVHGWSHTNYADAGEKKQELGRHRPADEVLGELRSGFRHLGDLHEARFVPLLVPPWNRIDASLVADLAGLGYEALSVYGPEKPCALPLVNTHVDVMDWHGTRGCRDRGLLEREIVARLRQIFDSGGTMGLLTHHLVHDTAVWSFLEALFTLTAQRPGCRWMRISDVLRQHCLPAETPPVKDR